MTDKIVVLTTCGSAEEGERLARHLLESRTAACVNVLMQNKSFYRWLGKIQSADECLPAIKTTRAHFDRLRGVPEAAHSYELPEVPALPAIDGSPTYPDWLDRELAGGLD